MGTRSSLLLGNFVRAASLMLRNLRIKEKNSLDTELVPKFYQLIRISGI